MIKLKYTPTKWDLYFIELAELTAAKLSYCKLRKVGAIAVRDNRPLCNGYNGTLPGQENCCEQQIEDPSNAGKYFLVTKPNTEHAERNLIYYAARKGIALEGAILYCTDAPCEDCARAIISSGISKVFYRKDFKSAIGLDVFDSVGFEYHKI